MENGQTNAARLGELIDDLCGSLAELIMGICDPVAEGSPVRHIAANDNWSAKVDRNLSLKWAGTAAMPYLRIEPYLKPEVLASLTRPANSQMPWRRPWEALLPLAPD